MSLRKLGLNSSGNLKSNNLKSLIRSELKDIINESIQEYLLKTKIPVATIDINVDKSCDHGHYNSPRDSARAVRLNISNTSVEIDSELDQRNKGPDSSTKDDKNLHWMAWTTNEDKALENKSLRRSQCVTPTPLHRHRCTSPFVRANSAVCRYYSEDDYKDPEKEYGHRRTSARHGEAPKYLRNNSVMAVARPRTSVAVGPDRHYEEIGTNTRRSYQVSDYLKKSMNLNDPYERSVYSTLMEIMRTKNDQRCGVESQFSGNDPIVQISEYKHRYQNPRTAIEFPRSSTQTLVTVKKPPICPHKSRVLGQLRPQLSSTALSRSGEQFLY